MEEGSEIEWKCKSKVSSMDLQSYAYVTKIRQMKLNTLKNRNLSKLDDDDDKTGASSSVTVVNQPLPPMRPFQLTLPRITLLL